MEDREYKAIIEAILFTMGESVELEKIAKNDCVVAIGECGLDYNRNFSPQDLQRKWFEELL